MVVARGVEVGTQGRVGRGFSPGILSRSAPSCSVTYSRSGAESSTAKRKRITPSSPAELPGRQEMRARRMHAIASRCAPLRSWSGRLTPAVSMGRTAVMVEAGEDHLGEWRSLLGNGDADVLDAVSATSTAPRGVSSFLLSRPTVSCTTARSRGSSPVGSRTMTVWLAKVESESGGAGGESPVGSDQTDIRES